MVRRGLSKGDALSLGGVRPIKVTKAIMKTGGTGKLCSRLDGARGSSDTALLHALTKAEKDSCL